MKAVIFTIQLLLYCTITNAQLVSSNILQRVFLVKYNEMIGSIFTIEVDNRQYLISAKHLFVNISKEDTIELFHNKQWEKIKVNKIGETPIGVDVIVLTAERQISPTYELIPNNKNYYLSQEVFFLGFPFGISTDIKDLNNYFPIPLVKRGILSAFLNPSGENILLIDGINNKGFSGGPVVLYELDTNKLAVIGIISGYKPQRDKIKFGDEDTVLEAMTNSGLLIAYSIEHALNIIKNNPIGFKI